jgi:hypothetical protein
MSQVPRCGVACQRPGCDRAWPRDPVFEVACPACHAGVGQRCKRPSGHRVFAGDVHPERDRLADRGGHYGPCPLALCGLDNVARRQAEERALRHASP